MATRAPRAAMTCAMPAPMPDAPPVTRTTFPARSAARAVSGCAHAPASFRAGSTCLAISSSDALLCSTGRPGGRAQKTSSS